MAKYLLLRDNKQTGPHSFDEMLELGFRKYDLVWVEGKSAAWRYPGEISEFKEYAPLVEEQPYDRFFKRKTAVAAETAPTAVKDVAEKTGSAVKSTAETSAVKSTAETSSFAVKATAQSPSGEIPVGGLNGVVELAKENISSVETVNSREASLNNSKEAPTAVTPRVDINRTEKEESGLRLKPRRVAITMPGNRKSVTAITPVAHLSKGEKPVLNVDPAYAAADMNATVHLSKEAEPVLDRDHLYEVADTNAVPHLPKQKDISTPETLHSNYWPGAQTAPTQPSPAKTAEEVDDDDEELIPLSQIPPKPFSGDYTRYLQYAGVAAALISLLILGILIGQGLSSNSAPPPTLVSEQPSRIAELRKKLYETPIEEPKETDSGYEPDLTAEANAIPVPAKLNTSSAKKNITVRTSYKTSSAPPAAADNEKREAVKRVPAPENKNAGKTTDLAGKLKLSLNDYKVNMFGGIDGIEVSLKNTAPVTVSEAIVELRYILSNKNKKHLTEIIRFRNLKPGESKTLPGPKSSRGIRLESSVISAK